VASHSCGGARQQQQQLQLQALLLQQLLRKQLLLNRTRWALAHASACLPRTCGPAEPHLLLLLLQLLTLHGWLLLLASMRAGRCLRSCLTEAAWLVVGPCNQCLLQRRGWTLLCAWACCSLAATPAPWQVLLLQAQAAETSMI
jgi:hypothetical protein